MKNITALLQTGELTPKQRYLLLIHNDVAKSRTGKEVLTEADKHALEHWQSRNSHESHEWNMHNEGWKYSGRIELEAEFFFQEAQTDHFRKQPISMNLSFYPFFKQMKGYLKSIERIKKVSMQEAVVITGKQRAQKLKNGVDFDYAVYMLAFELLSEADRKRFKELYVDVECDHQYLDQEEIIANLFNDKDTLTEKETKKAKEKIAELIAENCYNKFAKKYQLFHYFACIPLAEVARRFLIDKNIDIQGKALNQNQEADDEDDETHDTIQEAIEQYSKEHNVAIEDILKESCLTWLDGDLLDQYTPLVFSNENELLQRWLKTKIEARAILKKYIDTGELKVRKRTVDETRRDKLFSKGLYDNELKKALLHLEEFEGLGDEKAFETFNEKTITGESLYAFTGQHEFIQDFKKRTDEYDANLGLVYADEDSERTGEHLDQELLVCGVGGTTEHTMFSSFSISVELSAQLLEFLIYFKETEKDGETFLEFKDKNIKEAFIDEKNIIAGGYAKLLAFKGVLERLSKIYETDLTHRIQDQLTYLDTYIDYHNDVLSKATGQTLHGGDESEKSKKAKHWLVKDRGILKIDMDLFIDKSTIVPDADITQVHIAKLREIFGGDF